MTNFGLQTIKDCLSIHDRTFFSIFNLVLNLFCRPKSIFVELEELHEDDKTKKMEWVETARWLKVRDKIFTKINLNHCTNFTK